MNKKRNKIIIFDFMRTLYDPDSKRLIEDAVEILTYLNKENVELYLISRNEGHRLDIIIDLDIEKYFKKISLVEKKTVENFSNLIEETEAANITVIGDYIYDEIRIGNHLGFRTIWFKNGKFKNLNPKKPEEKANITITKLGQIKTIF